LIHLIVDVKKCVRHFFVRTHPFYMRPQMDGPVVGSVTGTELYFKSGASKVEVGYRYGLILLKMSWLDLFGLKMDSKSTPKPTASF